MLNVLCRHWWVLALRGVCAIAAGMIAIAMPNVALASLVAIFAAFAILDGIANIVMGIRGEADGTYWWTMIVLGVVAIAAGVGAFAYPLTTLAVFLTFVAVTAILRGVLEIAAAIRLRKVLDDEWVLGLSGALSILFGALLLSRPIQGLVVMALIMGIFMVALGVMAVALALRLRKVHHRLAAGESAHVG
jgi:uncharacterized membrane protein HdeD (DUF308 family)